MGGGGCCVPTEGSSVVAVQGKYFPLLPFPQTETKFKVGVGVSLLINVKTSFLVACGKMFLIFASLGPGGSTWFSRKRRQDEAWKSRSHPTCALTEGQIRCNGKGLNCCTRVWSFVHQRMCTGKGSWALTCLTYLCHFWHFSSQSGSVPVFSYQAQDSGHLFSPIHTF